MQFLRSDPAMYTSLGRTYARVGVRDPARMYTYVAVFSFLHPSRCTYVYMLHARLYYNTYVMTYKYRGSLVVLSISKSVEPNEEQKEMTSGFQ